MGCQALVLGLLTVLGAVRFWQVCLLAVILGLNNAFENSARQAFVREMVGKDELRNAITLNSVTVNAARAVGPAIGGVLIATVGVGVCFLANAASFVAVVTSLIIMNTGALRPSPPAPRARGQLREGLRVRGPHAGHRYPARHDGPGRDACVRVPGVDSGTGQADLPRRLGGLWLPDRRDGDRRGHRRPVHGRARADRPAVDDHRRRPASGSPSSSAPSRRSSGSPMPPCCSWAGPASRSSRSATRRFSWPRIRACAAGRSRSGRSPSRARRRSAARSSGGSSPSRPPDRPGRGRGVLPGRSGGRLLAQPALPAPASAPPPKRPGHDLIAGRPTGWDGQRPGRFVRAGWGCPGARATPTRSCRAACDVISSTTRLTSGTSLVIRVEIRARMSSGSRAQSAVMASSLVTGRSTTG